jgi:ketosteroid isomerase-like protein
MDTATDEDLITAVTIRYCWALDTREFDRLSHVFTPDAVGDYGSLGTFHGPDEIAGFVAKVLTPLDASQHLVSNHDVAVNGDTATCRCQLQAQHFREAAEGGATYLVGGYYVDDLVRTPAGWRIHHRSLHRTWTDGNHAVVRP